MEDILSRPQCVNTLSTEHNEQALQNIPTSVLVRVYYVYWNKFNNIICQLLTAGHGILSVAEM